LFSYFVVLLATDVAVRPYRHECQLLGYIFAEASQKRRWPDVGGFPAPARA